MRRTVPKEHEYDETGQCKWCEHKDLSKASFAAPSGSAADVRSERMAALKFAQKWLWENRERQTVNCEWPAEFLNDTVSMMMAYRDKQQND